MKLYLLALLAQLSVGLAWNVCNWPPYFWFTFVGKYPVAQQFCTQNFPVSARTTTSTAPVKTITVTAATSTTTQAAPTPTTTLAPVTNTVTTTTTTTTTSTSTVTTTQYNSFPGRKREVEERGGVEERGNKCPKGDPFCDTWNSCLGRDKQFLKTLCSCIETPRTVTVTTTPSTTSTSTPVSTVYSTPPVVTITPAPVQTTTTVTTTQTSYTATTTTVQSYCGSGSPNACGSSCVNFQTDKNNCNGCGNKCQTGYVCSGGSCIIPNQCTYSGTIYYCYGQTTCACYGTTEGRGFCADPNGACGPACTNSDNCSGQSVCLASSSVGCGTAVGYCTTQGDFNTCRPPSRRDFTPRGGGGRNAPVEEERDGPTLNERLAAYREGQRRKPE